MSLSSREYAQRLVMEERFYEVEYAIAEQDYRAVRCYAVITRVPTLDRLTKEYKMRGFVWFGLGVLLLLAWGISTSCFMSLAF